MKKIILSAILAITIEFTGPHSIANGVEYIITGTGNGSLNGISFSNRSFTFNLFGDTANYSSNGVGGHQISPLNNASFLVGGFESGQFLVSTTLGVNDTASWVYFSNLSTGLDLLTINLGIPIDIKEAIYPIQSVYAEAYSYQFANISTTLGGFSLNSVSSVSFSSNAVPESSTYALFGIGAMGLLMVMRRKKTV
jgi:hypothetical protein